MQELIKTILADRTCDFSPINGVRYFIDVEESGQITIGEDSEDEDAREYEIFPSVEAALTGFMIDGKAIADYHPTVTKAKASPPIELLK